MTHIYPHLLPNISDWPIREFDNGRRKIFVEELNDIVFESLISKYGDKLEDVLSKTIYLEKSRVKNKPWKVDPRDDKALWVELGKEVANAVDRSDKEEVLKGILKRIINRYNEEIVGGFKIKTFKFARKFLTLLFKIIFNKFNDKNQRLFWGKRKDLLAKIHVDGYVEETRQLFSKGTVVLVPTHFSNLDSIMIGYAVDSVAGLPAFSYGAGLNLYDSEIAAYFMNRLGAYRVDRRKKSPIYLACLISMASHSLIKGVNNIFFPGGTRSRSGAMEEKLKLGLLGSVIDAQRNLIQNGSDKKIYIVPLILGYNFVLEAKNLVEQHLRQIGREKYARSKENKPGGFSFKFLKLFFSKKSEVYLTFGEPMDILGNKIDLNGASIDKYCNPIDIKDYFIIDDHINENNQREQVYARLLGQKVLKSYFRNNLVLPSHLVAFVGFQLYLKKYRAHDLFGLLRMKSRKLAVTSETFYNEIETIVAHLKELEKDKNIRLHKLFFGGVEKLIEEGLSLLGVYHTQKVLYILDSTLRTDNIRLLYFYHNRLSGYNIEEYVKPHKKTI